MYGKEISKPMRKLGHFNLIGKNNESIELLLKKLQPIIIKMLKSQRSNFPVRAFVFLN